MGRTVVAAGYSVRNGGSRADSPVSIDSALEQVKHGAWQQFVIAEHDAPQTEADREKMDCCHCELGVFYMILSACGCDTETDLPWMRSWFLQHQLSDGGLNCEPDAMALYLEGRVAHRDDATGDKRRNTLFLGRTWTVAFSSAHPPPRHAVDGGRTGLTQL